MVHLNRLAARGDQLLAGCTLYFSIKPLFASCSTLTTFSVPSCSCRWDEMSHMQAQHCCPVACRQHRVHACEIDRCSPLLLLLLQCACRLCVSVRLHACTRASCGNCVYSAAQRPHLLRPGHEGSHQLAGTAPGSPEVHQHGSLSLQVCGGFEIEVTTQRGGLLLCCVRWQLECHLPSSRDATCQRQFRLQTVNQWCRCPTLSTSCSNWASLVMSITRVIIELPRARAWRVLGATTPLLLTPEHTAALLLLCCRRKAVWKAILC